MFLLPIVAFSNDTSGLLAAVGLNTFFTGSNASDLSVNPVLTNDPSSALWRGYIAQRSGQWDEARKAFSQQSRHVL